ncbi:MAG: hypothetical protein V3U49_01360 [Nitrososphaerales archaeon]
MQEPEPISAKLRDALQGRNSHQWFKVPVQIVGGRNPQVLPRHLEIHCLTCGELLRKIDLAKRKNYQFALAQINGDIEGLRTTIEIEISAKGIEGKGCGGKAGKKHCLAITHSKESLNHLTILIKDLDDTDEGFSERKYRTYTAFLIGVDEPKSSRVNLVGVVIPSGKGKEASILSYGVQLLETDPSNYLPTERDLEDFHKYFRDNADVVNDLVSGHAPRIVGKNRIKEGIILVGHSPSLIQLEGDVPQRALLRLMQVGPTKTAKSATNKAYTDQYRVGEWASGESASRAGLTYFVDIDSRMIEWGLLPRNDLGICVVNGLHIFKSIEFLEALESMKIVVNRAIKGSAPCRTRILADANPEGSFKDVKYPPMYRCVELLKTPFFHGRPEMITRFDFFFVTRMNDVSQEDIDRGIINPPKPKILAEIISKHMKWVFSLHPNQIKVGIDQEENDKINSLIAEANSKLLRAFGGEEIPIVHRGSFYQILRVALAYAAPSFH